MSSKPSATSELIKAVRHPDHLPALSLGQWDRLLRIARKKNLLASLAESCSKAIGFECIPPHPRIHLMAALTLSRHQQQAIEWEARHIAAALSKLGITIILLKGAAYSMAGLDAARGRLFGDVDILVPKAALNEVEAALMLRGWTSSGNDAYDQHYYRQWMHELPPMMHRVRGTAIDVHHNLLPVTAKRSPDIAPILADARALPGTGFSILSPCDMVLHSATHLFYEGELHNGLRDLLDLDALLAEFMKSEPDFWNRLVSRAKQIDLSVPLCYALRYTSSLLGTSIPDHALRQVSKDAGIGVIRQRMLDSAYTRTLLASSIDRHDIDTVAAEFFLYLRGHYLRMPTGLLLRHLGRKAAMRLFKNTSRAR